MNLIKGQTIKIDSALTYELYTDETDWELGCLVKDNGLKSDGLNNGGCYRLLENDDAVVLSDNRILMALPDIDSSWEEVLVFATRRSASPNRLRCTLKACTLKACTLKACTLKACSTHQPIAIVQDETVDPRLTLVELCYVYRKQGGWKYRVVFQGYSTGLAGLYQAKGMNISSFSHRSDQAAPVSDHHEIPKRQDRVQLECGHSPLCQHSCHCT